jgi:hypothetical protein
MPPSLTGDLVVQVIPEFGSSDISVGVSVTVVGPDINVSQSATTVRLNGLTPDSYRIEVALLEAGTLPECTIQPNRYWIASVVAGTTTSVEFEVYCRLR